MKQNSKSNSNCPHYFSEDGKYYCYERYDPKTKSIEIEKISINEMSSDVIKMLIESDHDIHLNNFYQLKLCDQLFEAKNYYFKNELNDDSMDPWESLADKAGSAEDIFFAEPEPENPQAAKVRKVIENECTEAQKDFFYMHFGLQMQLETMRRAEAAKTGKLPSAPAMTCRKNKIIDKVAKTLGVNRVKRIKKSK